MAFASCSKEQSVARQLQGGAVRTRSASSVAATQLEMSSSWRHMLLHL